ncbi:EpsI family protein [Granulicella pectinivorans]|uniref:EpsI family protein n=1 Tax=Granulicella pectinivorans TaxID=474950 RepID=A0A1I6MMN9_9BACT|nr:exosortase C-terminal domain/associated protein EpsI [Granulicella pectinivorans]SFS16858.1 EpsI family protein [Granulicella pectinivorans]
MKQSARLFAILILLLLARGLIFVRGDVDTVPPSAPLTEFPSVVGPWNGKEIPLDPAILQVLGKGSFLNRTYSPDELTSSPATQSVPIGLFIGYFPTQRTGQAIHSPQNCLPGSGWTFDSKDIADLTSSDGSIHHIGEYIISNGKTREEVLYWYHSHGRDIASDYSAKMYTLLDSIRLNRTDAALVRIITPIQSGESRLSAHRRAISFAEHLSPILPAFIPD